VNSAVRWDDNHVDTHLNWSSLGVIDRELTHQLLTAWFNELLSRIIIIAAKASVIKLYPSLKSQELS
jgi:hypothetical protein